jgi:hypothetical protein
MALSASEAAFSVYAEACLVNLATYFVPKITTQAIEGMTVTNL